MSRLSIVLFAALLLAACGMPQLPQSRFGDQAVKTTVAMVELHKLRYGEYPETLDQLRFKGDWDAIWLNYVSYRRLEQGYELNILMDKLNQFPMQDPTEQIKLPAEFFQNTGLVKTNVVREP